ncbi:MAG TPA: SDR family NAD(P)-dependent oxidoreductase [Burkholderiales bacterium]|nr:SDR family NAD(P)-dependent oxidoreductase [Burkholderiales bacterium]
MAVTAGSSKAVIARSGSDEATPRRSLVVLVTGGSRGIGRAVCVAFGAQGHTVVAAARDVKALEETARLVREAGGVGSHVTCDMRDPAAIEAMVLTVIECHGRIDILVNNAGGGTSGRPMTSDETPDADWLATIDLNLTSVFRTCKAVTPHMKERRSGAIVTVASIASRQASNLSGIAYTAAKSGLAGLNRHLAKELGPYGIRVNAVAPGIIASERVQAKFATYTDDERAAISARVPLGRIGTVEEVASVVAFLASPGASYVHGALIDINGGMFMA